ncbi:IclR family transcriptional regulator [Paraburkholderia sp. BCC1884]|uniref:IclR family transcriptional regulator n=1 Tax=Paraburkholderia sp. BCC1884 TaxID=2562668 RepID=UPI0011843F2E|nr:IclR family transcriptional regulator [Paraburkholderia sp. BCC1884]
MNDYTVASVDTALRLLAIVADHPRLGLSELAERAGINTSRTFRLLSTLATHRLVERVGEPASYRLGTQALALGVAASRQIDLAAAANTPLMQLVEQVNEAIQIRVRDGDETVCIARVESSHAVRVHGTVGNRRPLHVGASGKLYLAFLPDEERDRLLASPLRSFTRETRKEPRRLKEELAHIRATGYAISRGEATPGVVAIAVPVFDSQRNLLAALGASIVETRFDEATLPELIQQMHATASEISRLLGHRAS